MAAAIGASLDEHEAHGKGSGLPPADVIFGAQGKAGLGTSAGRQRGGVPPFTAPGAETRKPTDEDEALARRLNEQWISEDTAAGNGLLGGLFKRRGPLAIAAGGRVCVGCGLPITDRTLKNGPGGTYHAACLKMASTGLPACSVCHGNLPLENGRVHFYRHNFFNSVYCPWHHGSTPRCYSCMRLEPNAKPGGGGEGPFAQLQDGRMVCITCAKTAVVDSSEGAPAFQDVCDFLEHELLLPVTMEMRQVPILVVDAPTLNEQTHRETPHGKGGKEAGIPTTRGLTLAEVATVMHMGSGAMHFNPAFGRFEVGPPTPMKLGEERAVTAILVLCGLPYASFSSILAHEAMHAVMKLDTSYPTRLPQQVEEGMCQLIAWLWLERLAGKNAAMYSYHDSADHYNQYNHHNHSGGGRQSGDPPSDEDLRGFFAHQIKTDVSPVYGDGFRKAKVAYDTVGLEALLHYIKHYHKFPEL
ncbi:unnamed protein product [Ascophyllum nodosum]